MNFTSEMLAHIVNDFLARPNINQYFAEITLSNGEVMRVNRVRSMKTIYPWMKDEKQGCEFAIKRRDKDNNDNTLLMTDDAFRLIHQSILDKTDNVLKIHAEIIYSSEVVLKFDRYRQDNDNITADRIIRKPSVKLTGFSK